MPGAVKTDGTEVYAEGESFKTGSEAKAVRLEAFVDWLLLPENEREPRTKKAFGELYGVGPQTVRNDMREPYVQRELASRARAVARVDRLPAVLDNLYRLATGSGDPGDRGSGAATPANAQVSAARAYLDWMLRTEPIREADLDVRQLNQAELMQVALAFLDEAAKADDATPE